jgi:pilus assembly protein Flp/PilA
MTKWLAREEGQGMVEYALIIALVAILLIAALTALSTGIGTTFNDIVASL